MAPLEARVSAWLQHDSSRAVVLVLIGGILLLLLSARCFCSQLAEMAVLYTSEVCREACANAGMPIARA